MALKNSLSTTSPFGKLILLGVLMLLGVAFALGVLFSLNALVFNLPIHSISIADLNNNPQNIITAKVLQIFSQVGLFILPALLFAYLTNKAIKPELSFTSSLPTKTMLITVFSTLLAIPFINLLAQWNSNWHLPDFLSKTEEWMRVMQTQNDQLMELILIMDSPSSIALNFLMMAILPAIGEELIFRGVIQKQLTRWVSNPHLAIFLTAVFFSAFHMQFLGFLSRLLLGMLFGYLFYYSKNIWVPILAHFVNNSLALVLALTLGIGTNDDAFNDTASLSLSLMMFSLFMVSMFLVYTNRSRLSVQ